MRKMLSEELPVGNISVDIWPTLPYSAREMIRIATQGDAAAVHAIYAPIVRDTAISFECEVPTVVEIRHRMEKVLRVRPWLVYEANGQVLGYTYASVFRERAAYR